jgi:hypothetical protein
MGIPWHVQGREEFEQFQASQRAHVEKDFPLIECGSQFSQCFKLKQDCEISKFMITKNINKLL